MANLHDVVLRQSQLGGKGDQSNDLSHVCRVPDDENSFGSIKN